MMHDTDIAYRMLAAEIGRAACRERVQTPVGGGT